MIKTFADRRTHELYATGKSDQKGTFHFPDPPCTHLSPVTGAPWSGPPRTPAPPEGVLQPELRGAGAHPVLRAIGRAAPQRMPNVFELRHGHRQVDQPYPLRRQSQWPNCGRVPRMGVNAQRQTAPWPVLGTRHQVSSQCIALDIAHHCVEIRVVLYREGLISPLPDPSAEGIAPLVAMDMASEQPVCPFRQAVVETGTKHKMKMIGHQAERQYLGRGAQRGLARERHENRIIERIVEYRRAGVTPVDDVVTDPRPY